MENENETFLSDWLANKISDDQLRKLVTEAEFRDYQKLKNTLNDFTISNPDLHKNFEIVQQKIENQKPKTPTKVIPLWRYSAIAATLLLFFGLFQLLYFSNENDTTFGSTQKITLPDDSKVTLNAKSKLSYPNLFRFNRTLKLEGEAYFEVQKGSTFTVETTLGSVKVLGTKFNVNAYKDYFEVVCYEGKVRVTTEDNFTILTPSESVRFYDHTSENWADITIQRPSWIIGESAFKNVPVKYVIDKLKNQYNREVDFPINKQNIKFTGTFTHKNIETALKSICIPLHLKFKIDSRKITITE